jgi:hypothetical protein
MHALWTFAFGVANDTRPGAACCQQIRRMEKVILDDLDVGWRWRRESALLWRLGVLRHNPGESNLMFGGGT